MSFSMFWLVVVKNQSNTGQLLLETIMQEKNKNSMFFFKFWI